MKWQEFFHRASRPGRDTMNCNNVLGVTHAVERFIACKLSAGLLLRVLQYECEDTETAERPPTSTSVYHHLSEAFSLAPSPRS